MRRTSCTVFRLFFAFLFLTAMGGKGGGFERAPRVDKNFAVTVTDGSGNKINGEKFSWEGRVHFAGSLGMASITIPFEKIKEISIGEKKEKKVKVTAKLKDGGETAFDIEADSRCYGDAPFGSFMLTMEEIRNILFKNP
ncbi:MAG TPA: hypothetical protein VHN12_13120 [Geobacteraceae bacterium]|nr:hypothetical protein [Geobacteraceae bacterium]